MPAQLLLAVTKHLKDENLNRYFRVDAVSERTVSIYYCKQR